LEAIMLKTLIFAGVLTGLVPAVAMAQPRYWQDDQGAYATRNYGEDPRYQPPPYPAYGYEPVPYVRGHPAYDQYGPDPNGTRAPDGHRYKCKLQNRWDPYTGGEVRVRECR
jgi:hypothetical protein